MRCASLSDSYSSLVTVSGVVPAGIETSARANSGEAPTAAAATPAVLMNSRRVNSELDSQSGQLRMFDIRAASLEKTWAIRWGWRSRQLDTKRQRDANSIRAAGRHQPEARAREALVGKARLSAVNEPRDGATPTTSRNLPPLMHQPSPQARHHRMRVRMRTEWPRLVGIVISRSQGVSLKLCSRPMPPAEISRLKAACRRPPHRIDTGRKNG